jgi:long-chain acyl-CoA synthetase
LRVPYVDTRLLAKIKERLTDAFGGQLHEIIIGGAALNNEVEAFLRKIEFPCTVGYGMTECAPLIAYAPWRENKTGSCGRVVDRMECRVASSDPRRIPGELWVRGENVMLGYYKNDEATKAVMKDGWMNTGDLATIDDEGFIFLKGRSKNMILGPSGQNIYPEEIEQEIDNLPYVNESLVIDEDNHLKALVYPDIDSATAEGLSLAQVEIIIKDEMKELNKRLPTYSQISGVQIYHEEFEKTPKRSIKRYLYQH